MRIIFSILFIFGFLGFTFNVVQAQSSFPDRENIEKASREARQPDASDLSNSRLKSVAGKTHGDITDLQGEEGIKLLVAQLIRIALSFLGVLFLGIALYSGFLWMTAGGSDTQVGTAKKLFLNSVIGLVIVAGAFIITAFVLQSLQKATTQVIN